MRKVSLNEPDWSIAGKWGAEIADRGFTAVPNALLKSYSILDITPAQFLVLVNLESFRWNAKEYPYPSIERLARRMGVAERSVTRNISALENKHGLIERIPRSYKTNAYSFEPIICRLNDIIRQDFYDMLD